MSLSAMSSSGVTNDYTHGRPSANYLNMAHVSDFSFNNDTTPYAYGYYDYNGSNPQNVDCNPSGVVPQDNKSSGINAEKYKNSNFHESPIPSTPSLPALEQAAFQNGYDVASNKVNDFGSNVNLSDPIYKTHAGPASLPHSLLGQDVAVTNTASTNISTDIQKESHQHQQHNPQHHISPHHQSPTTISNNQQQPIYTELQNYQGPYYSHPHLPRYENSSPSSTSGRYQGTPASYHNNYATSLPNINNNNNNNNNNASKQFGDSPSPSSNLQDGYHNMSPYSSASSPSNFYAHWPKSQIGLGGHAPQGPHAPPASQAMWPHHQYSPGPPRLTPPSGSISPSGFQNPITHSAGALIPTTCAPEMMGAFGHGMGDVMGGHPGPFVNHPPVNPWTIRGKKNSFVSLYNGDMWARFHTHINEMIITKHGRRMFPVLHFLLNGLDPNKYYHVWVDMVLADNSIWKFQGGKWVSGGSAEPMTPEGREYPHPDSPNTGSHWMKQEVSFGKLKLTNNKNCQQRHVILNSMHRYQPRIHVAESLSGKEREILISHAFEDTQFIAVTAYQNMDITQLKIDNNPFAKGFRDNFESRLRMSEAQNQEPFMSPHSGVVAPNISMGHPSWGPSCPSTQGVPRGVGHGPPTHPTFFNMYHGHQPLITAAMDGQSLYPGNTPMNSLYGEGKHHDELTPVTSMNSQPYIEPSGHPYVTETEEGHSNYHASSSNTQHQHQLEPHRSSYYPYYPESTMTSSMATVGHQSFTPIGSLNNRVMTDKNYGVIENSDYFRRQNVTGNKLNSGEYNQVGDWKSLNTGTLSPNSVNDVDPRHKSLVKSGDTHNPQYISDATNKSSLSHTQNSNASTSFASMGITNETTSRQSRTYQNSDNQVMQTTKNTMHSATSASGDSIFQTRRNSPVSDLSTSSSTTSSSFCGFPSNGSPSLAQSTTTSNLNALLSLCQKPESSSSSSTTSHFNTDSPGTSALGSNKSNPTTSKSNCQTTFHCHEGSKVRVHQSDIPMNVACANKSMNTQILHSNNNKNNSKPPPPDNFLDQENAMASYDFNFDPAVVTSSPSTFLDKELSHDRLPSSAISQPYNFYPSPSNVTVKATQSLASIYHPHMTSATSPTLTSYSDNIINQSSGTSGMTSLSFTSRDGDGTVMDFGQLQRQAAELSLDFMSKDVTLPHTISSSDLAKGKKPSLISKHVHSSNTATDSSFIKQFGTNSNSPTNQLYSPHYSSTSTAFHQVKTNASTHHKDSDQDMKVQVYCHRDAKDITPEHENNSEKRHGRSSKSADQICLKTDMKKSKITMKSSPNPSETKNNGTKRKSEKLHGIKTSQKKARAGNKTI